MTEDSQLKYPLETLGDERFQQVCQALLVREFPNTQCFPLNQADGGRDAVSPLLSTEQDFIVFQVKYVVDPAKTAKDHKWLTNTLEGESKKLSNLIPKGARQYVLLTNLPGTAHLESGSIDKTTAILRASTSIPASCWWRDDIERRLDDAWDIKWAYPEIMSNYDIIRMVLEHQDAADAGRRTKAVRAAMRDQYDRDQQVRFKQARVGNQLLDLFVDVPVPLPYERQPELSQSPFIEPLQVISACHSESSDRGRSELGAATLLLDPVCQDRLTRLVLEGAPGQGKSTVVQYVCQMHRRHLLGIRPDESRISKEHRSHPVRLPFKVDCRDFDAWVHGENPFSSGEADTLPSHRTLETFLSAQIEAHSGGASFSVDDLQALSSLSAILVVFDGLDEVADMGRRHAVVQQILKGVSRLEEISLSLQTIVTSRPASFADSPRFPQDRFLYVHLGTIGRRVIGEYTNRWLAARQLENGEGSDVRRILNSKLDQPHMAELARNPMQLAILLNLIYERGESLPDKRTALYDAYVDLFFAREGEKSAVVKNNRDLLIQIHGYLAWILHSEAQTKGNRGSVTAERLRLLVADYLHKEQHQSELVDHLFSGITERVVALVSRIEGTFEFEVQPLREYFAARFLYNTAPYSPAGDERRGTLPDRFEAMSRDLSWQNVTRFYAGCYSRGQLPSLVFSLRELTESDGYAETGYPQSLAAALLSDWTFAQYPRLMKDVVALLLGGIGIRHLALQTRPLVRGTSLVLPALSGKEELVETCFELLLAGQPKDYSQMLLDLIASNDGAGVLKDRWCEVVKGLRGSALTQWLSYGAFLGLVKDLDEAQVNFLIQEDPHEQGHRICILARGGMRDLELTDSQLHSSVNWLLEERLWWGRGARDTNLLEDLARSLSPASFAFSLFYRRREPLYVIWQRRPPSRYRHTSGVAFPSSGTGSLADKCAKYISAANKLAGEYSAMQWSTELKPWIQLVESGRSAFGDTWAMFVLAYTSAGVPDATDSCSDAKELFDARIALCRRSRYARLRAGNAGWWRRQLSSPASLPQTCFALLLFFGWAGPKTMCDVAEVADRKLKGLPKGWWAKLQNAFSGLGRYLRVRPRPLNSTIEKIPKTVSPRFVTMLSERVSGKARMALYRRFLVGYRSADGAVLKFCLDAAFHCAVTEKGDCDEHLRVISRCYARGASFEHYLPLRRRGGGWEWELSVSVARKIVREFNRYPLELVGLAEDICRTAVARRVTPVGDVAARDGWFDDDNFG